MHNAKNTFDSSRTAIVFIEFQKEWLSADGKLFEHLIKDKAAATSAVRHAEQILAAARRHGWTIVHAGLDFRNDRHYRLFGGGDGVLGLRAAIPHAGTWTGAGAEFVAPFVPQENEFVVAGRSGASVLKNSTLDPFLRNNRIDTLILAGFATHVCVESTLREAHDMGMNTWVASDACAAFTTAQHDYFMENILHHFGAGITTEALLAQMEKGA